MSSLPSSKSITGIKSNTLNSKLRMALNPRFHGDYSFEAKLKNCDVPIKFVVIFGKWNKDDDNKYHILITNNLRASAKTVVTNYLLRWGIEHCFKELKDTFYFDHYQVRHINKIDRYWNLLSCCMDSHLLDQNLSSCKRGCLSY